jgi:hypothetical protein
MGDATQAAEAGYRSNDLHVRARPGVLPRPPVRWGTKAENDISRAIAQDRANNA